MLYYCHAHVGMHITSCYVFRLGSHGYKDEEGLQRGFPQQHSFNPIVYDVISTSTEEVKFAYKSYNKSPLTLNSQSKMNNIITNEIKHIT